MPDTKHRMDPTLLAATAGILSGLAGFAIWMATDMFVFLPVFLAVGLVTGILMAEARRKS